MLARSAHVSMPAIHPVPRVSIPAHAAHIARFSVSPAYKMARRSFNNSTVMPVHFMPPHRVRIPTITFSGNPGRVDAAMTRPRFVPEMNPRRYYATTADNLKDETYVHRIKLNCADWSIKPSSAQLRVLDELSYVQTRSMHDVITMLGHKGLLNATILSLLLDKAEYSRDILQALSFLDRHDMLTQYNVSLLIKKSSDLLYTMGLVFSRFPQSLITQFHFEMIFNTRAECRDLAVIYLEMERRQLVTRENIRDFMLFSGFTKSIRFMLENMPEEPGQQQQMFARMIDNIIHLEYILEHLLPHVGLDNKRKELCKELLANIDDVPAITIEIRKKIALNQILLDVQAGMRQALVKSKIASQQHPETGKISRLFSFFHSQQPAVEKELEEAAKATEIENKKTYLSRYGSGGG